MSNQRSRVLSGSVANAVQMSVGFLGIIVLSRMLGPSDIGLYFWVLSIVSTLDGILNGFISAVRKRIPEVESDINELLGVLSIVLIPTLLVFGLSVGGVVGIMRTTEIGGFTVVIFIVFVLSTAVNSTLVGLERIDLSRWLQAGRTILRTVLQVILVGGGAGTVGMFTGYIGAMTITIVIGVILIGKRPIRPSYDTFRSVWKFARYSIPGGIVSRLDESVDEMIAGLLFASAVVGNYGVAIRLVAPALLVPSVIQGSLSARLSRLESEGKNIGSVIHSNLSFAPYFAIPLFFGALAIPEHIIVTVFSSQYADAASIFTAIALSRVVKSFASPMTSAIAGFDRPRAVMWINIASSSIMVLSSVVLGILIGPIGIALGLIASLMTRVVLCAFVLIEYVTFSQLLPQYTLIQFGVGAIMFGVVKIMDFFLISDVITILLTIGVGGIVYIGGTTVLIPDLRDVVTDFQPNLNL